MPQPKTPATTPEPKSTNVGPASKPKPEAKAPRWPSDPVKAVAAKLAWLQVATQQVEKSGQHAQGYRYFQEHKLMEQYKPLLSQINASVTFGEHLDVSVVPKQVGKNPNGNLTTITGCIVFRCGDTGGEIRHAVVGQGEDTSDKGAGKAQTYAFKFGLQKLGLIPTEAIADADNDEGQPPETPAAAASAQTGEQKVSFEVAKATMERAANLVKSGAVDPNKITARLSTYRTDNLAALTIAQHRDFEAWLEGEVERASAVPT